MLFLKVRQWIFTSFLPLFFSSRCKDKNFECQIQELLAYTFSLSYKECYFLPFVLHPMPAEPIDKFSKRTINVFQFILLLVKIVQLAKGTPLAYLIHSIFFYESFFYINRHVLIPRPETEELVDMFVNNTRTYRHKTSDAPLLKILDIGTGSGNISISIRKKIALQIVAVDFSEKSLNVARRNARNILGSNHDIIFHRASIFDNVLKQHPLFQEKFSWVVTNPPYVGKTDKDIDANVVRYEPHHALFSGKYGLDFFTKLSEVLPCFLLKRGILLAEMGHQQAKALWKLFDYLTDKKVICDMQGKKRFFYGVL